MMGETNLCRSPNNLLLGLRECELCNRSCDRSREGHLRGLAEEDSVVQNHIEQRFMNPDAAVILNKTELAKAIHEEADA
jgi:hypothetical protein